MVGVPSKDWRELIYVDVIEASSWLRYSANVGAHRPLYSTSLGLTMLAFTTTERQRQYIEATPLTAVTHHTITSRTALQQALRRIRAEGCACSSGSIEGATGVSAPVFDSSGELQAAVGMAGPTARYERDAEHFKNLVVRCGEQMSRALGFTGDYPSGPRTAPAAKPGPRITSGTRTERSQATFLSKIPCSPCSIPLSDWKITYVLSSSPCARSCSTALAWR